MWSWFTNGNLETNDGDSIAEGIGQGRVTKNIEGVKVDRAYRIPDQTGLTIVYQLLREEGLFLGLSSGINVAGAVRSPKNRGRVERSLRSFATRVTKYQSTFSIETGSFRIISIQIFRWNRFSIGNLKIFLRNARWIAFSEGDSGREPTHCTLSCLPAFVTNVNQEKGNPSSRKVLNLEARKKPSLNQEIKGRSSSPESDLDQSQRVRDNAFQLLPTFFNVYVLLKRLAVTDEAVGSGEALVW